MSGGPSGGIPTVNNLIILHSRPVVNKSSATLFLQVFCPVTIMKTSGGSGRLKEDKEKETPE
jgi:hypothetical protein